MLTVETSGGVALIRLNDPDRRNILSADMVDALVAAVDACEGDGSVHALVITGSGSAFCAGADRADLAAAAGGDTDRLEHVYAGFLRVLDCELPTIAAVNGPAVGAGLNLALSCDVRIAARSALFESRFLTLRLHPGGGHTWLLRQAVGSRAAAMLLLGEPLDGAGAAAAGLALRCVDDDRLVDDAVELARRAASVPVELLTVTKRTLREAGSGAGHSAILALELERQVWSMDRPGFRAEIGLGPGAPE